MPGEVTAAFEKQFGSSAVNSKASRTAGPLCENFLALVLGDVEEGGVLGAKLAGDEVDEVEDLRRNPTERADNKAGNAP